MENCQVVSLEISEMTFVDWQPINILLPKNYTNWKRYRLSVVIYYH